ncbi:MAG: hypothetical protein H6Q43_887 [Deltaproteobacteria bacterium]|nr:hypothetical protein [Deltaproteobacteria bacterium]
MLPGIDVLKNPIIFGLALILSWGSFAAAQDKPILPVLEGREIYAVVKDTQGEKLEGFLRFDTEEINVRSQDNQEKKIPVKYLKSITLEKSKSEFPEEDQKRGVKYTVRIENSQEIFTLDKKYTFSLNTNLGLTTKSLDPDLVNKLVSKDSLQSSKLDDGRPLIQDKSVVFSLEIKF